MRKNQKGFAVFFLPIIVGGVFIIGYLLVNRQTEFQSLRENTPSNTPKVEYPVDRENDGIYRDFKYKFQFTYPNDVFIIQRQPQQLSEDNSQMFWYTSEEDSNSVIPRKPWISLSINHVTMSKERLVNDFNTFYNQKTNVFNSSTGITKIRELPINGGKGIIFTAKKKENADVPAYTYSAAWLKGEDTIWLGMNMEERDTNNMYKKYFNQIVNSFKFIE